MNQIIEKDELINLLPHKDKMFLLTRINSYDIEKNIIEAQYEISSDCIFYNQQNDGIPSWVSFELMAQGVSALTGISDKIKNRPPQAGCILSVMNYSSTLPFIKCGTTVNINAEEDFADHESHVYKYRCIVSDSADKNIIAESEITVMKVKDMESLF